MTKMKFIQKIVIKLSNNNTNVQQQQEVAVKGDRKKVDKM